MITFYDECPLENQENSNEIFSLESEMSILELCDRFLCLLKQGCIIFLVAERSGTPISLLMQVKNYIDASEFASKDMYLSIIDEVFVLADSVVKKNFDESTIVVDIHQSYNHFIELICSLQKEKKVTYSIASSMPRAEGCGNEVIESTLFTSLEVASNDDEVMYEQLVVFLRDIISSLGKNEEFKHEMYDGARDREENSCSRKFVSRIQTILEFRMPTVKITCQKRCLDGNCDIIINKDDFVIPVEAKKNKHPDLWTAVEEQLIKKYMKTVNLYGIYLVYWFGEKCQQSPPKDMCKKPQTHTELENLLQLHTVPNRYANKVTVICIDCTVIT